MKELLGLRKELLAFRVLDPACGSGNFLYVAYREMVRLEVRLLAKFKAKFSTAQYRKHIETASLVSPRMFYGIDRDTFAVELAKVTLMLAKKLALDEAHEALERAQVELPLSEEEALPLENLDDNFQCVDALFAKWPEVDAIVGNPPYQSKNKIRQELGRAYVNSVRDEFPEVDGRADYCVYWFRRAHDHLKQGQRAGLVGTNTIRQNYSRTGGLDYIVDNGGTITTAVSTMKWSGDAAVDVSIVNWIKGKQSGKKRLYIQEGNDPTTGWRYKNLKKIGPSLSFEVDVTNAQTIRVNSAKGGCYQGQTHGHSGFLLTPEEAQAEISEQPSCDAVLFPFLIAEELFGGKPPLPTRYVIDFHPRTQLEARSHKALFNHVQTTVLPDRKKAAQEEKERNEEARAVNPRAKINHHHENFLKKWWLLSYPRKDLLAAIEKLPRFIVCGQVTKRPIFEFVHPEIRPNAALIVFPFADDYSFGILQSHAHWLWFTNRCSTLTGRFRYTSNTVFDAFPWPQSPKVADIAKVARCGRALRSLRHKLMEHHDLSLRELYRTAEEPGDHPLKDAQKKLDKAVLAAYGSPKSGVLESLLDLNEEVVEAEAAGESVVGPGLPPVVKDLNKYISDDCLKMAHR